MLLVDCGLPLRQGASMKVMGSMCSERWTLVTAPVDLSFFCLNCFLDGKVSEAHFDVSFAKNSWICFDVSHFFQVCEEPGFCVFFRSMSS